MKDPDGNLIYSSGVYKEIDINKKIFVTDHFSDEFGNIIPVKDIGMTGEWSDDLLITIEFSNTHSDKTKVVIAHEGIPSDMHDDCVIGWNSSINKIQKLVERH